MTDAKLQKLMKRTADCAEQHMRLMTELGEAVKARYGVHYSDVDCDAAIDVFDHGGGSMSVSELDNHMANCGAPKLEK